MAVHKATRSNPSAQPQQQQPQHAKSARAGDPKHRRRRSNHQLPGPQNKSILFDILHHLNRGYGIALAKLSVLENNGSGSLFPRDCLRDLRHRTEELRALANHQLLRIMAGREEHDALRFGKLRTRGDSAEPTTEAQRHGEKSLKRRNRKRRQ